MDVYAALGRVDIPSGIFLGHLDSIAAGDKATHSRLVAELPRDLKECTHSSETYEFLLAVNVTLKNSKKPVRFDDDPDRRHYPKIFAWWVALRENTHCFHSTFPSQVPTP